MCNTDAQEILFVRKTSVIQPDNAESHWGALTWLDKRRRVTTGRLASRRTHPPTLRRLLSLPAPLTNSYHTPQHRYKTFESVTLKLTVINGVTSSKSELEGSNSSNSTGPQRMADWEPNNLVVNSVTTSVPRSPVSASRRTLFILEFWSVLDVLTGEKLDSGEPKVSPPPPSGSRNSGQQQDYNSWQMWRDPHVLALWRGEEGVRSRTRWASIELKKMK